ncbi:beta-galactosidase/beta-glucuronidase [Lewinella aquimaris]|uniref:Beta-galactosidase/beta-glucuronidase n=1 Tax=Neolewinella aquimaris TaxID=1835722 RepID=A0A840EE93_9BACT|nr:sugar-binding domain-containing protein [Neolewinella aquimaris]MBB4080119.1 beta-galactosidase/beta-glucuronidase [Neolewinella aquimaris]
MAQEENVLQFQLSTPWTDEVSQETPWNVYPRPQLTRDNWVNLNGKWDYAITLLAQTTAPKKYDGKILVPFAVESTLSGVKKLVGKDQYLWYRRNFTVPPRTDGERLLLHFGAVDFRATVYVNGRVVGGHEGGYVPFSFDVTDFLRRGGAQELTIRVWDPTDAGLQPRGKQVSEPGGIFYTPVTGIWQTVWLEAVPQEYITSLKVTPNVDEGAVDLQINTTSLSRDLNAQVSIRGSGGQPVAGQTVPLVAGSRAGAVRIPLPNARLWSPEDPFLYPLTVTLTDGSGKKLDEVGSYVGMRKVSLGPDANGHTVMLLNDMPYFQFGPLDQGWWPDGLYTAPTPEAMVFDIEMTKKWGFNMLRKHVKTEPATFYHACDTLGVLVWQDMPSGYIHDRSFVAPEAARDAQQPFTDRVHFEREYREMIDALYNFPSIAMWVPFNEGWGQYDTERIADWTRAYDPTRLVDAPSGWTDRGVGDVYDAHLYPGPGMEAPEENRASVLGEFGGLGLVVPEHLWWDKRNWGYQSFTNQAELDTGFRELIEALYGLRSQGLAAAVYTQTTDVEGEVNGLMTYDRKVMKLDTTTSPALFTPLYAPAARRLPILATSELEPRLWEMVSSEDGDLLTTGELPEDAALRRVNGPFVTYADFFQPKGTGWNAEEYLYLTRHFTVDRVPDHLFAEFINTRVDFVVYLNGQIAMDVRAGGGGFGHYTVRRIDGAKAQLREGKNTVAIRVKGTGADKNLSFDLGLFGTED